jgi:hypothetical protein
LTLGNAGEQIRRIYVVEFRGGINRRTGRDRESGVGIGKRFMAKAFFVDDSHLLQCLEIFEDDLQSADNVPVASLVLLWSF